VTAGGSVIAAYLASAVAVVFASAIFAEAMLNARGLSRFMPPIWQLDLVVIGPIWFLAHR